MGNVLVGEQQEPEEHEISEEDLEGTPEHTPPQEVPHDALDDLDGQHAFRKGCWGIIYCGQHVLQAEEEEFDEEEAEEEEGG